MLNAIISILVTIIVGAIALFAFYLDNIENIRRNKNDRGRSFNR